MSCLPRRHHPSARFAMSSPDVEPVDGTVRVGDVERDEAVALLGDATAAGYLSLDELEVRLEAVWAATTAAQLEAISSDLPAHLRQARALSRRARPWGKERHPAPVAHLVSYLAVMTLLVLLWLILGMTSGSWYPWPVWPALGWGVSVAAHLSAAAKAP